MFSKALEWASYSIRGTTFGEHVTVLLFYRTFKIKRRIKRYVKMPCKQVSLFLGAPLGNLEEIRLPEHFERNGNYIWVPFLDPEDIRISSLGAIWDFGKGTGLS
jgi:hypothetical protein